MTIPEKAEKKKFYTYQDYITWDDDFRREIIDGVIYPLYGSIPLDGPYDKRIYSMAAPSQNHQEILLELAVQLRNFLRGKRCKVFIAPFDVKLTQNDECVVQPDISVVCNPENLKKSINYCNGPPDFIIEILSPSSIKKDQLFKFNRYLEAGVKEYWIVDPQNRLVKKMVLLENRYITQVFGDDTEIPVTVLDGCVIDIESVFGPLPELILEEGGLDNQ